MFRVKPFLAMLYYGKRAVKLPETSLFKNILTSEKSRVEQDLSISCMTMSSLITDVAGSFVAVLALAVLYECVTGLHVHLRSNLSRQERETTLTRKKSDFEKIK